MAFIDTRAEHGVSYAEAVAEHLADGQCLGRFMQDVGLAHGSYICGVQLVEPTDQRGEVVRLVTRVGVDADNHFAARSVDAPVHGPGNVALGIVDDADIGTMRLVGLDDFTSPVGTHAVDKEHFEVILGIILLPD